MIQQIVSTFFQWDSFVQIRPNFVQFMQENQDGADQIQVEILQKTLQSSIQQKFPVHPQIRRAFFKKFVLELENLQIEVLEEFYKASIQMEADNDSNCFYKSYFSSGPSFDHLCSLLETREMISQGTTGLKTWPASKFLVQILPQKVDLQGVTLLELGSGAGFCGLSLLKTCPDLSQFVFTDCHESVLRNLRRNVQENGANSKRVSVQKLDWEQPELDFCLAKLELERVLVIGSDVVFDLELIQPLVRTLTRCFEKMARPKAVIANVLRNSETKKAFENCLLEHQLEFNVEIFHSDMLLYEISQ